MLQAAKKGFGRLLDRPVPHKGNWKSPSSHRLTKSFYSTELARKPMKVIFFGTIWPEATASAAGVRTLSLLKLTSDMGCEVHFCTPARLHLAPMAIFEQMGVRAHGLPAINSTDVDDFLLSVNPDLVIFDRFLTEEMFGWRVRAICPNAAHVIDTQDLHFLRHARQHIIEENAVYEYNQQSQQNQMMNNPIFNHSSSTSTNHHNLNHLLPNSFSLPNPSHNPSPVPPNYQYYMDAFSRRPYVRPLDDEGNPIPIVTLSKRVNVLELSKRYPIVHANMIRELAAIHRSDMTFVVSHFEKDLLVRQLGIPHYKLEVAPFYYEDVKEINIRSFKQKMGFSMLGHFKHAPNRDAIHWMKNEIWPRIRTAIPSAVLDIFGAHPDKQDMELSDPTMGLRVVGTLKAEDLMVRLQKYRISLAPLRFGAGIKGKIADNWAAGTPTVATSIAAESMFIYGKNHRGIMSQQFGGSVADTAEEFAKAAISLYVDGTKWNRARAIGYETLATAFSAEVNGPKTMDALWRVVQEREYLRDLNLTGSILWSAGYRYNEMFGRFVQMKSMVSSNQAAKFVDNLGKDQLTTSEKSNKQNRIEQNNKNEKVVDKKKDKDQAQGQDQGETLKTYPGEEDDIKMTTARGLGDTASIDMQPESLTDVEPSTESKAEEAKKPVDVDAIDRKLVFEMLSSEQAKMEEPKKKTKSPSKPSLSDFDVPAFVSFKRSLKQVPPEEK